MKRIRESQLKAVNVAMKREKAKENAFLGNRCFDEINIQNSIVQVALRGKDVEYEINMNPRYANKEKEYYNDKLSREEKILKKSNGNMERLMQIVNNANKNFSMDFQYIVFSKELVGIIRDWLDDLSSLNNLLKYGKIHEDIEEFKRIFPNIQKEWLVIDGNSYFSTIHEIYLGKQIIKSSAKMSDIRYWAKYYAQATSKGKGYNSHQISLDGYKKDVQMLQFLSLVLEKNMNSWSETDKRLFSQRLHRLTFAIAYRECLQNQMTSLKDVCATFQALKYLVLHHQPNQFQISKRMDYMTFISLFKYEGELEDAEPLNMTCYNIKLFRHIIEGMITRNANHLSFDYTMDCLNEIFQAETEYQNLSLRPIQGIEGIQARDRLNAITALCNDNWLLESQELKRNILSGECSVDTIHEKLQEIVKGMISVYEDFLKRNAELITKKENTLKDTINNLYTVSDMTDIVSLDEFSKSIYKVIKELKTK